MSDKIICASTRKFLFIAQQKKFTRNFFSFKQRVKSTKEFKETKFKFGGTDPYLFIYLLRHRERESEVKGQWVIKFRMTLKRISNLVAMAMDNKFAQFVVEVHDMGETETIIYYI